MKRTQQVLIAETRALGMAVKREMSIKRLTNLRRRLQTLAADPDGLPR